MSINKQSCLCANASGKQPAAVLCPYQNNDVGWMHLNYVIISHALSTAGLKAFLNRCCLS